MRVCVRALFNMLLILFGFCFCALLHLTNPKHTASEPMQCTKISYVLNVVGAG